MIHITSKSAGRPYVPMTSEDVQNIFRMQQLHKHYTLQLHDAIKRGDNLKAVRSARRAEQIRDELRKFDLLI